MPADPLDLERTDEQPKSQYLSKRDIRIFLIALAAIAIILYPAYQVLKRNADKAVCKRYLKEIHKAVLLYASDNGDLLPPVYDTAEAGPWPFVDRGQTYSWAYKVQGYFSGSASYRCPGSHDEEVAHDHVRSDIPYPDPRKRPKTLEVSFGMYHPHGGMPLNSVANPGTAILFGDSSNGGANDTYNPVPFKDENGGVIPHDAFALGWNTSNTDPAGAGFITRLAYPGTANGVFEYTGQARHPGGNHYITVDGRLLTLKPTAAKLERDKRTKQIIGYWALPDGYEPRSRR